ncbi:MAG: PLP-dependent aspartate aminotransferase family protein [Pseudomonadota bacterium]
MKNEKMNPLTKCIHAGGYQDRVVGGVATPIYTSSSYRLDAEGGVVRYPRYFNIPTQTAVAEKAAALENGQAGLVVSSGMAAVTTALVAFLKNGDHVLIQRDVYGGTYHFAAAQLERFGIDYSLVDGGTAADFAAMVRNNTRVLFFETPTNPLLKVVDIGAMAALARARGLISIIDNTFASPINQNPLDWGVDVVLHSGTKYLGGHGDLCCGVLVASNELMASLRDVAINMGFVLAPQECYLLERSLKTLGLRVRQSNVNGQALSEFLSGHGRVRRVNYPGLPTHPGHEIAARQMTGFGGMFSVEFDGDGADALKIVNRLKLFSHAVSLGGVESLVCFPALTSHAKLSSEERKQVGISDSLLRFSAGAEDAEDLIADLRSALEA